MAVKVILTRGLPASGKSTWARAQIEQYPDRYKRVNRDDIRQMIDNGKWSKAREKRIKDIEMMIARLYFTDGFSVIIDDTNLSVSSMEMWQNFAQNMHVSIEIQDFTDVPLETCIERDLHRLHSVGERVIRKMYRDFLQVSVTPPAYNHALPDALIVDLDGTLALMNGRNPYDTAQCENDLLNEPVADIVKSFMSEYTVLFTSGRSEQYRAQTERWLHYHCFKEAHGTCCLFMRPEGDNRQDAIVKREIYERHIAGKYNVKFVLDDRNQCIALWRSLGLTALQVADGDF